MRRYKVNARFGKNVRKARKRLSLSQEELAEKIGISRNHMGRLERGEINVMLVLVERIAKKLKIKPSEILPF